MNKLTNKTDELGVLNKELKDIEIGKELLNSKEKIVKLDIERIRAEIIENPIVLSEIEQLNSLEEHNLGQDWLEEEENIQRDREKEITALGDD